MFRSWGELSYGRRLTKLTNRYMKEWFPKEVKEKQKENDDEVNREMMTLAQQGQGGAGNKDCIIM